MESLLLQYKKKVGPQLIGKITITLWYVRLLVGKGINGPGKKILYVLFHHL